MKYILPNINLLISPILLYMKQFSKIKNYIFLKAIFVLYLAALAGCQGGNEISQEQNPNNVPMAIESAENVIVLLGGQGLFSTLAAEDQGVQGIVFFKNDNGCISVVGAEITLVSLEG